MLWGSADARGTAVYFLIKWSYHLGGGGSPAGPPFIFLTNRSCYLEIPRTRDAAGPWNPGPLGLNDGTAMFLYVSLSQLNPQIEKQRTVTEQRISGSVVP